jgi:hypothetical protein
MKQVHGVVLLLGSLPVFRLLSDGRLAGDIILIVTGFAAASVTAVAVTGCLCLLTQCRIPRTAADLLRLPPKWAGTNSPPRPGGCLNGQVPVHNKQRKQHQRGNP